MILDDNASSRDEVLALENARFAAMTGGRLDELERLFADDAVYTHSSSIVRDKAGYIRAMREGEFAYKSIECSETNIAFEGGAAMLTGRVKLGIMFKTRSAHARQSFSERLGEDRWAMALFKHGNRRPFRRE
jgi:hypothetical protein